VAFYGSLRRACARFDSFQVDLSSGELLRSGVCVPIQDQPFQILRLLLQADGRVVTREQVRTALWPENTFVDFEHGVNTAVKKLRQALEDSAESPKFVETLPRIGYRFLVPVEWVPETLGRNPLPSVVPITPPKPTLVPTLVPAKRQWKLKSAVALAILAVIVSTALLFNENSGLSRTRLGTWIRHVALGQNPERQRILSQRRLTANPDDTPLTGGAISPDGKYLAFTDSSGFYVRQVDGGETHAVPLPKGFEPLPESWFPDSAHLVVSWFGFQRNPPGSGHPRTGPPSLWKISVLGGAPRKLADEGSGARVSPDGSRIAFLTGRWDNEEVWLMAADGSDARKILDGGKESYFGPVAWAPDGKRFATVRAANGSGPELPNKRIEVYDPATGLSELSLSNPRLGDEVDWTNAGRLIYSVHELEPNQSDSNLWWTQIDPAGHSLGPPARITSDQALASSISVSADGRRLALLRRSYESDIYLAEIARDGKVLTTPRRFTLDERQDWPTSWTRDSDTVLFLSDRDGPDHIFKQNISDTQPELLVGGNDIRRAPRLTPDGLSVLYLVTTKVDDPAAELRLLRIPVSGGPSQLVLQGPGITAYQCASLPYTVCIYEQVDSTSEYYRFFTFDPAGTKGTEILAGKIKKGDGLDLWSLSPNGKYLVAIKSQNPYDEPALRIFDLAAGTERSIPLLEIGLAMGMDWAADSKSIWVGGYLGRGAWGTRSGILNVSLAGKVSVATKGFNPEIWYAIPSPDGRRLALMGRNQTSNMWLVENF